MKPLPKNRTIFCAEREADGTICAVHIETKEGKFVRYNRGNKEPNTTTPHSARQLLRHGDNSLYFCRITYKQWRHFIRHGTLE